MRLWICAAALIAPAALRAQTLPVTCNASGAICTPATPVVNPDGSLLAGNGTTTRTTAAGTSDTVAVPVQGVTNGVPQSTVVRGGGSIVTGQVSVGTSATLIVAARATRQRVSVAVGAANSCAFGPSGVTLTTGFVLQPIAGATDTSDTTAALYGVCSAATTIRYKELVQ